MNRTLHQQSRDPTSRCVHVESALHGSAHFRAQSPGEGLDYNLAFAPSREFKYEASKARILQMQLDFLHSRDSESITDAQKRQRLSSEIDLDAKEAICATGGLRMTKMHHLPQR